MKALKLVLLYADEVLVDHTTRTLEILIRTQFCIGPDHTLSFVLYFSFQEKMVPPRF
jgi:hypothetical protein